MGPSPQISAMRARTSRSRSWGDRGWASASTASSTVLATRPASRAGLIARAARRSRTHAACSSTRASSIATST